MPSAEDKKLLLEIIDNEKKWIAEKDRRARSAGRASAKSGSRRSICRVEVLVTTEASRSKYGMQHGNCIDANPNLARLAVDVSSPVARIVLRNPPLNVIDIPMMEELAQALAEIEARSDISVVVLSGEGKAFSAGVDVAAHTPDKVDEMLTKFHAVIRALVATQESHDRCGAWALPGRRRGTGHGLRHRLHHRIGAVGISRDQAGLLSAGGVHGAWLRWWDRSGLRN